MYLPIPRFRRQKRTEFRRQVRRLDEAYPNGSSAQKLHGLILCVRDHYKYKGSGDTKAAIAQRTRTTLERVEQVIEGNFVKVPSDCVEAVLRALNATPVQLEVAVLLYDKAIRERRATRAREQPAPPSTPAPPGPTSPSETDRTTPARDRKGKKNDETRAPNPMAATTVAEFVKAMKAFHAFKGRKPLRQMAKDYDRLNDVLEKNGLAPIQHRAPGTYSNIGKNGKLPSLQTTRSYIVAAGGDLIQLIQWEEAWARLSAELIDPEDPEDQ